MKLGDMLCPWHPDMTLFECQPLHEAVDAEEVSGDVGADG